MVVIIPEDENVGEIIVMVNSLSLEEDPSRDFLLLPKAMLKDIGLQGTSKKDYINIFKSKNFLVQLKKLYNLYAQDKENSKKNSIELAPLKQLGVQIKKILNVLINDKTIDVVTLPSKVERAEFYSYNINSEIESFIVDIVKGPEFTKGQKFINIIKCGKEKNLTKSFQENSTNKKNKSKRKYYITNNPLKIKFNNSLKNFSQTKENEQDSLEMNL